MQTEKLYDTDSHLQTFSAQVLSCEPAKERWNILLDRTAFYPEGGGQPSDLGTLNGIAVTHVREQDGQILHVCEQPIPVGSSVTGTIDWERRFDLMQQHSGEHIVSGLVHAAFGYDNVGFHMGQDMITIDFNGDLTESQLRDIEAKANEVVVKNLPVHVFYPDSETLAQLPYRSKKALSGAVRLVEYPGTDLCACCGTHVSHTGEIGPILLLTCVRFRSGVRIEMLCGNRSFRYARNILDGNHRISNLLSAKPLQTADAVQRTQEELARKKYRVIQLEDRLFARIAEGLTGAGNTLLFEDDLDPDGVRRLAVAVAETCGGRAAVFSGGDGQGYKYALCHPDGDLRQLSRQMNDQLQGRGGGKPNFVQGSVQASRAQIQEYFQALSQN